jgi:4-amino-4-deoxy-L-arabinose transferase-like glycosyltransferase
MKNEKKITLKLSSAVKWISLSWGLPILNLLRLPAGLALACLGVYNCSGIRPNWIIGIPAQLASALLLIYSSPKTVPVPVLPAAKIPKPPRRSVKKRYPAQLLQWVGLLVFLGGDAFLFRSGMLELGWIIAIGLILWAGWLQHRYGLSSLPRADFPINASLLLGFILLAAAILRFSMVWTNLTGLQADEANNLAETATFAFGKSDVQFSPFIRAWGGTPAMPYWIVGAFFKLFGTSVWLARLVSALASLGALWFFYGWCRNWLGNLASLTATSLMALSWWFLYFSLSPFHNAILIMTETASFYFMEKGIRRGKRMDFWWAGIFAAACVMNYVPGRTVPAMMVLTVLAYGILRGRNFVMIYWKPLSLSLIAFFWFVTPYFINLLTLKDPWNDSYNFWYRAHPGWITEEAKSTGSLFFLVKPYFWTLSSFWSGSPIGFDYRFATGAPFLDPVAGAAALLGVGLCFFNIKKNLTWVLVPGFFWGLSANALSIQAAGGNLNYVHAVRLSIVIPILYLAVGWGLEWLFGFFKAAGGRKNIYLGMGLAAAMALSFGLNGPAIWHDFSQQQGNWDVRGFHQLMIAKLFNSRYSQDHLLAEETVLSPITLFLTQGHSKISNFNNDPEIPIRFKANRNVILVFQPSRVSDQGKEKIRATYPNAIWNDLKDPWGVVYYTTVEIKLKDIQDAQRGLVLGEELP